jgi:class 3 adenylate cyclase
LIIHRTADLDDETDTSAADISGYMATQVADSRLLEVGRFDWLPYPEIAEFVVAAWEQRAVERQRVLASSVHRPRRLDRESGGVGRRMARAARGAQRARPARARTLPRRNGRYRGRRVLASEFDGPARAIRCACSIRDAVSSLGLGIRVGVHTGECDVVDGKLGGLAVAVGARVAAQADVGEVLVSATVNDLVAGSGISLDARGLRELKGIGEWPLYAVDDLD